MLTVDTEIFFQRPEEADKRILHRATVIECAPTHLARLDKPLELKPAQHVLVYYEDGQVFMKQPSRIIAVDDESSASPTIAFETTGEAVSAESRGCYRVSTVTAKLQTKLAAETCPLTDVSLLGFSAISKSEWKLGERVQVSLQYRSAESTGTACVQSIKDLGDGRTRYGFLLVESQEHGKALQEGLRQVTMEQQRSQLRRRRRAG